MMEAPDVKRTVKDHPLCICYCVASFLVGMFVQGWLPL